MIRVGIEEYHYITSEGTKIKQPKMNTKSIKNKYKNFDTKIYDL